ncbi:MAG: hypothetical protein LBC67_03145 [Spirochaetales bacterium]|jgi:hypothetical protein|nr:hypothetical protein [Spirochaetales bacterium]
MQLVHNEIPREFLNVLPEGIKFIALHGRNFLVVESVFCPQGHSLRVDTVKIHGEPAVHIGVRIGAQEGGIFIDSFWGSHNKLYDFIPGESEAVVEAFCPVCGASLMVNDVCKAEGCGGEAHIQMLLPGGKNRVLVCGRLGCPGHRLALQAAPGSLVEEVSAINYFGTHIDDFFGGI